MWEKNKKLLDENYDYYRSIKDKTEKIAKEEYNITDEILISKLYNLVLNLCNQMVYDYVYVFTKDDLYFVAEYNINIHKLLNNFIIDILGDEDLTSKCLTEVKRM